MQTNSSNIEQPPAISNICQPFDGIFKHVQSGDLLGRLGRLEHLADWPIALEFQAWPIGFVGRLLLADCSRLTAEWQ